MNPNYSFHLEEQASAADKNLIRQGLTAYNRQFADDTTARPLSIFVRNRQGELVGGLLGYLYWGWLAVDVLWVQESARHQGVGSGLLVRAEAEACAAGIFRVHLDTMGFQALPFYQKHGYIVWGQLDNFVHGHARYYLRKELTNDS